MKRIARRQVIATVAAGIAVATLGLASSASAQIQLTPDSQRYLIQREVGAEQWAISYNFEDGTVTGNVFNTTGTPPQFIWCEITDIAYAADPSSNQYTLDCFGSEACAAAPCDANAWSLVQAGIQLSGNFFLPPLTRATFGGQVEPIFASSCAIGACHDSASSQAGLDLTPGASYENIVDVMSTQMMTQSRITPFDLDVSYLYAKITGTGMLSQMPVGGSLSDEQIVAFRNWIQDGAPRN